MNPLARDPDALAEFRRRVDAAEWERARRMARVLGLHRVVEQRLMERDDVYLRRLARRVVPELVRA